MFMSFSNASIRSNSSWTFCCRDFSESFLSWYFLIIKGKTTTIIVVNYFFKAIGKFNNHVFSLPNIAFNAKKRKFINKILYFYSPG